MGGSGMSVRRLVTVLALALMTARCGDQPTAVAPSSGSAPHFLRWAGKSAPQFRASSASAPAPLSLDQYAVSFWAVRGESRTAQLNYRDAVGDAGHPFLTITIKDPIELPDSTVLAEGDSVLVTVTIDTTKLAVSLTPTGLQFDTPA